MTSLLVALLLPLAADPQPPIVGKVVSIEDGDTIGIFWENREITIRLEGIDAPERGQPFGTKARQALAGKIAEKTVRVEWKKKDRYGRILGHVYLGDRWINCEMLRDGMAWHFKRYNRNAELGANEEWAWRAGRGLWADEDPQPPWEYRAEKRAAKRAAKK